MKSVYFIGSAREDLKSFPEEVRQDIGYALYEAQGGRKSWAAKPLRGFGGAGVLEIIEDYLGDTYRAVYTVRFSEAVYVLHCFQKKSKRGIKTALQDIELIKRRLKAAEDDDQARMR
ncbi:MAG: type II toxin-antitoxin system RelE/ParE family toxin [Candidatus Omnitrophica bacterium]|nr:type II toxin-antitoxin system RelE/ParE family toxin [Candidatus Omnitrophota bacterium]